MSEHVDQQESASPPMLLVERFLDLLCSKDIEGAVDLLGVNVEYANVGLPTVRGRGRVRRVLRAALGFAGFEVIAIAIVRGLIGTVFPTVRAKPPTI
jgi:limonene-1,2-epoxide hydrolase